MVGVAWLLTVVLAGAPAAQPDAPPEWLIKPTDDQIWWAYPTAAVRDSVSGSVKIRCRVQLNGLAANCEVLSEEPAGMGFGEAALKLTNLFKFKPRIENGRPTEDAISTTVDFVLPKKPLGPPPPKDMIDLARRLVDATDAKDAIKQAMENDLNKEFESSESDEPMSASERQAAYDALQEVWVEFSERILRNLAEGYARRLTRAEMEAAIAFYESPVGRRLLAQARLAFLDARLLSEHLLEEEWKAMDRRFCEKQPSSRRCYDPAAT